jgi:hypothetical protein
MWLYLFCLLSDGIVKYMRNKAGPSSKLLSSVADAQKFLASPSPVVIGEHDYYGSFSVVQVLCPDGPLNRSKFPS